MKHKFENMVRSFGMSGYQITTELREIEKTFSIELGHTRPELGQQETDYYPQFEREVRLEAGEMAQHYEAFYCLEKSIRRLISEAMEEAAGANWWSSGKINPTITNEVGSRIQREIDSGVDWVHFSEPLGVLVRGLV